MIAIERELAVLDALRRGESDRSIARRQHVARATVARIRRANGLRPRGEGPAPESLTLVDAHRCPTCGAQIVHDTCLACRARRMPPVDAVPDPPADFTPQLHGPQLAKQQEILCVKCQADPLRIAAHLRGERELCPALTPPEHCPAGRTRIGIDFSTSMEKEDAA